MDAGDRRMCVDGPVRAVVMLGIHLHGNGLSVRVAT